MEEPPLVLAWLKKLFSPRRPAEVEYARTPEDPPKHVPAGPMTSAQPPAVPVETPPTDETAAPPT